MLALRAEKNASLPESPGPDRCAADAAGFAGAAVDLERQLEIPRLALAVAEVAQGGAAPSKEGAGGVRS